ncbi:alpha/beta fold hydrolase [Neobacillus citreus]|uniref:Alpha/beta hydrolase n=1 Tax=Neobacillus citreus TaxID=2833578 RepID=A0A942YDZ9_9BACI|nr:alpha/beta hydrolase [Neobacillus citreus]MCH6264591.1 alpha/beta hydrolase [Neobacillus citreus]
MITKKTLTINDQKISYIDEGGKTAPPVLLIHGVPESSMLWKHIIPEIAALGFRTIAPDLPGFGQSDRFPYESTWENYVTFINDFMQALELEKIHLIVHDWGGMIGLRWACDNPDKVESLIITDTVLLPGYTWHPLAQKWRTPGYGEKVMEAMANKESWMAGMKKEIPSVEEGILEDFFAIFESAEKRNVILELYRSANPQLTEPYLNLAAIKNPVTILWGENDPYISTDFAYQTHDQQFPHAGVHIIPDAGHFIHVQVPEKVIPFVKEHFLAILK